MIENKGLRCGGPTGNTSKLLRIKGLEKGEAIRAAGPGQDEDAETGVSPATAGRREDARGLRAAKGSRLGAVVPGLLIMGAAGLLVIRTSGTIPRELSYIDS
jgi:hypothetical protein